MLNKKVSIQKQTKTLLSGKQLKSIDIVRAMVCNATFNNISVISCWSVLLVEETGVPGENH
jgi:hypothetical protein